MEYMVRVGFVKGEEEKRFDSFHPNANMAVVRYHNHWHLRQYDYKYKQERITSDLNFVEVYDDMENLVASVRLSRNGKKVNKKEFLSTHYRHKDFVERWYRHIKICSS
jgi:hypothetical protein